jgi:hypothetical protein
MFLDLSADKAKIGIKPQADECQEKYNVRGSDEMFFYPSIRWLAHLLTYC